MVVWILWTGALLAFIQHFIYVPSTLVGCDYTKHWEASMGLFEGNSPYAPDFYNGFNYPLFATLPYLHLALVSVETGSRLWDIQNAVFILLSAILIAWAVPIKKTVLSANSSREETCRYLITNHWKPIVFFTIFSFQPAQEVILCGNIEPLSFILSTAFCVLYIRNKESWAGIFLAFFALVKLAPVLLIIPLLAGRKFKTTIACVATLSIYGLFLLVSGYWRWEIVFYQDIAPWIAWKWQGISCSIHRVIADNFFPQVLEASKPYEKLILIVNLICLALYGTYLVAWWKWTKQNGDALLVFGYGMILVFTPLLEINHFLWIFPAFFLMLNLWIHGKLNNYWLSLSLIVWVLIGAMSTVQHLYLMMDSLGTKTNYLPRTVIMIANTITLGGIAWSAKQPK